jgi:hypothetical protein
MAGQYDQYPWVGSDSLWCEDLSLEQLEAIDDVMVASAELAMTSIGRKRARLGDLMPAARRLLEAFGYNPETGNWKPATLPPQAELSGKRGTEK